MIIKNSCGSFPDPDISENLTRKHVRNIAALNENGIAEGFLVWMINKGKAGRDTEAELIGLSGTDEEVLRQLLKEYGKRSADDDVKRSWFEQNELSAAQKNSVRSANFSLLEREGCDIILSVSDLDSLKIGKKRIPNTIKSIERLQEIQFWQGITNCVFHGKKGIMPDLDCMSMDWYERRISCAVMTDERINGLFLIHKTPSGILKPVLFTAIGPDSSKDLLDMLRYSVAAAIKDYPPDTKIVIRRHDESVYSITSFLLPDRKGETVWAGERTEVTGDR